VLLQKFKICHFTQQSADVVDEIVPKRNVSMLDNGELDRGYCDTLLPVEGKLKLGILE
jgi:hypothetical protein